MMALSYVVLIALYVFEIKGHRVLSGIGFIYVADAMGGQVYLSILLVWQLVLSTEKMAISACNSREKPSQAKPKDQVQGKAKGSMAMMAMK